MGFSRRAKRASWVGPGTAALILAVMGALMVALLAPVIGWTPRAEAWAASGTTVAGQVPSWGSAADQLDDPQGVVVDGSGNVYVADTNNHRVVRWAPSASSGVVVAGGNGYGDATNQLAYPVAVALDGTGNLYVADLNNSRVVRWAPGASVGVVVAGGNGPGSGDTQLSSPSGVVLDSVGNLYVSDFANHRVQRFGWNGSSFNAAAVTIMGGKGYGPGADQLNYPVGLAIDSSNSVYVADRNNHRVQRWSGDGSVTTVAGFSGYQSNAANRLSAPTGVAVDISRTVFVADTQNNRIQRWVLNAETGTTVGGGNGYGTGATQLADPTGLAIDASGNLFVADRNNYRVQRFASGSSSATSATTVAGTPPSWGSAANRLWFPAASAVDATGSVYVVDQFNHRVQKWALNATQGTTVAGGAGAGAGADQLSYPAGVAVDAAGGVYVADTNNQRVVRWAPDASSGVVVAGGNGYGNQLDQLSDPSGVVLDATGNLYVTDPTNNRILRFPANSTSATSGTVVAGGNGAGADASQLDYPMGVALDATGNLYVADYDNHRVQKWVSGASSGTTVAGGNGIGDGPNQLIFPRGVAVDETGVVFVADTYNSRVQRWAPGATAGTTIVGGEGTGANQLDNPYGVTLSPTGNLYVADSGNHRIQKWVGTPGTPTIGVVTPAATSASIAFTPGDPGGSAPKYSGGCGSSNGGATGETTEAQRVTSSPVVVGGLTPGATYYCGVLAINRAGASALSAPSSVFTLKPSAPAIGMVARVSSTEVRVPFTATAPVVDGATYTATCTSSNGGTTRQASGTAPIAVSSLTTASSYSCSVVATNSAGDSPASAPSAQFTLNGTTGTAVTLNSTTATKAATNGSFTLSAKLAAGTTAIKGKTLSYRLGDGTRTALATATDRNGNVTATIPAPSTAGSYTLSVWFPGDATYQFSSTSASLSVVDKLSTSVVLTTPTPSGSGTPQTVSAVSRASTSFVANLGRAVSGETINFKILQGTKALVNVNGVSNASGDASTNITMPRTAGTYTLTISHADNAFYGASSKTYTLTLT